MSQRVEVSLGLWQDRPPEEVLETARIADRVGYPAIWVGEMATYDAVALATAVGSALERASLVVGPLAVHVHDPMAIAMAVASVASLTGRTTGVALGTSSPTVVEGWHGRPRTKAVATLSESARIVRCLLDGERSDLVGDAVASRGYHLRLPAPCSELTIAAFGPRAVEVAATHADRMVVNLVSTELAGQLVDGVRHAAKAAGRPAPRTAVWLPTAIDTTRAALDQLRFGVVGYLAAPGYADMFRRAGFGSVVDRAGQGGHPRAVLEAVPDELLHVVAAIGTIDHVRARIAAYHVAGIDDVVLVPGATDVDPAGRRTLEDVATAHGLR